MIESNEALNLEELSEDIVVASIRPLKLNEFIGQNQTKENLNIFIKSAQKRKANLDHVLLYGPPGLGKTTLAQIIATELGVNFRGTAGPILAKAGDLAAILTNLQAGDVLFIDEIHRLSSSIEEVLYSAMEDFYLDIMIGEGPAARSVRIDLPPFTLIGATTRIGLISNPLRDRFGIPLKLEFYTKEELTIVINRAAKKLNTAIAEEASCEIAKRSRGTPRIAIRLLKRVIDFACFADAKIVDLPIVNRALTALDVDKLGLDKADRQYLSFIIDKYNGGPVGVETIAAGLSEQKDTLEDAIEPYLLQQGFINRTPRGRVVNSITYDHLGFVIPNNPIFANQDSLFEDDNQS
jgi:Holliday junction DNA helicase RuvB